MDEYVVVIAGIEHTVLLDDAEAKRRGATLVTKAKAPPNKARGTDTKGA